VPAGCANPAGWHRTIQGRDVRIRSPTGDDVTGGPNRSRRRLAVAGIVVFVALAGAGGFFAVRGPDHTRPSGATPTGSHGLGADRDVVTEFNGDGDQETKSFAVHDGWEIRWDTNGATFHVAIRGDQNLGTVINQDGPGGGATYPVGSGTFQLDITAQGPWTIKIVNHPGPPGS
jgi:hypothetical protein